MQIIETRETRAFAHEIKFLIPVRHADEVRAWARQRFRPDPNAAAATGDTYRITSIYFDTEKGDVFLRTGSYGRAKFRIRRYGSENSVFLERKLRAHGIVTKRRTSIPVDDLARLTSGPDAAWPGHWFQQRIDVRAMAPVCQISYERMALLGENDSGPIRLTLDEGVSATEVDGLAFRDHNEGFPLIHGQAIVELKFRHAMPAVFKELLTEFSMSPQPVSKYRLAVPVLTAAKETAACA